MPSCAPCNVEDFKKLFNNHFHNKRPLTVICLNDFLKTLSPKEIKPLGIMDNSKTVGMYTVKFQANDTIKTFALLFTKNKNDEDAPNLIGTTKVKHLGFSSWESL